MKKLRYTNETDAFAREVALTGEIERLKHALRNAECAANLLSTANDDLHRRIATMLTTKLELQS